MLVILCVDYSPWADMGKKMGALLLAGLFIICLSAPGYLGSHSYLKKSYLSVCPGVWRNLVSRTGTAGILE